MHLAKPSLNFGEKDETLETERNVEDGPLPPTIQRRKRKLSWLATVTSSLICLLWLSGNFEAMVRRSKNGVFKAPPQATRGEMIYDFNDISPSEKLVWHPCFEAALCARLTVPMDYNRPLNISEDNPKVHIAISMIPGVGHQESGNYSASPLLLNPGGPGGSGVSLALAAGEPIQAVVSSDKSRDIIGFDPRGVGFTTPPADCWSFSTNGTGPSNDDVKTGAFNQMIWSIMGSEIPFVNGSSTALAHRDSRARMLSKMCKQQDDRNKDGSILRHLSTPAVARDMLSIVDAWDEWRKETGQDIADSELILPSDSSDSDYSLNTKGKLLYWGFSYGTLLGATFAAMFPTRVGRVILDGVVDADYYVSPLWAESLLDTDKDEQSFYHYCQKAGRDCAIYRYNDTENDIENRVRDILLEVKARPIGGVSSFGNVPFTVTFEQVKNFMFGSLYAPVATFPMIATFLDAFHRKDIEFLQNAYPVAYPTYQPFCSPSKNFLTLGGDAQLAIMCTDKRYPLNETLPNLEKEFELVAKTSHYADVWMSIMLGCDSFDIHPTDPPMRWDDHPAHAQKPIKTSFPLMFLSNTADPVTPLKAGVKMAKKFVDAGLIEQKSEGHCTLAAVSRCTIAKVRGYLELGNVPKTPQWGPDGREIEEGVWERCEADEWPWRPFQRAEFLKRYEAKHQQPPAHKIKFTVKSTFEEEIESVESIEAWKKVQWLTKSYFQPRDLLGGMRFNIFRD